MSDRDLFGKIVTKPKKALKERPSGQFGRPRRSTRADLIFAQGGSPKRLAAMTRRSLNSARATIERLAAPWADIDNSVEGNLRPLLDQFEEFEKSLEETVQWLLEEAPYD